MTIEERDFLGDGGGKEEKSGGDSIKKPQDKITFILCFIIMKTAPQ